MKAIHNLCVVNNKKHYFDPQNGNHDASDYFIDADPYWVEVLKIDNKIINTKIGSLFLPIK